MSFSYLEGSDITLPDPMIQKCIKLYNKSLIKYNFAAIMDKQDNLKTNDKKVKDEDKTEQ